MDILSVCINIHMQMFLRQYHHWSMKKKKEEEERAGVGREGGVAGHGVGRLPLRATPYSPLLPRTRRREKAAGQTNISARAA